MSSAEMAAATRAETATGNDTPPDGTLAAYQVRWEAVTQALSELEAAVVEAEVLWGIDARSATLPLQKQAGELYWHLGQYLRCRGEPVGAEEREPYRHNAVFGVLNDEFGQAISGAIDQIEQFVRPRLNR